MNDEERMNMLAAMVVRGELSATAYFDIVDARAEQWVEHELAYLDERFTLYYPEVSLLLAATIGVLFSAALVVILL